MKILISGEGEVINDSKENIKPKIKRSEDMPESYEDWKKRILAKAYADLKSVS